MGYKTTQKIFRCKFDEPKFDEPEFDKAEYLHQIQVAMFLKTRFFNVKPWIAII